MRVVSGKTEVLPLLTTDPFLLLFNPFALHTAVGPTTQTFVGPIAIAVCLAVHVHVYALWWYTNGVTCRETHTHTLKLAHSTKKSHCDRSVMRPSVRASRKLKLQ